MLRFQAGMLEFPSKEILGSTGEANDAEGEEFFFNPRVKETADHIQGRSG